MDWKQSYTDTCTELQMMQLRELELRKRWESAHKAMVEGKLPSSLYCHIDLVRGLELLDKAAADLNEVVDECLRLEGVKSNMEAFMNQFTGIDNVIECKRAQGYNLRQIAADMGYSYGYIRARIAKHDKVITVNANAM